MQDSSKLMIIVCYDYEGVILVHTVPHGIRVSADYYSHYLEHHLHTAWHSKRPEAIGSPIMLHDNARHVDATARNLFRWNWEVVEHPPNSPHMSPCDYDILKDQRISMRHLISIKS